MKLSDSSVELDANRSARVYRLTPRRRYPTVRVKPFRRSPLKRLAWIFGFTR